MNKLHWLIDKAQGSSFYLFLMNFFAARLVPFNKPHKFRILSISRSSVEIELPYVKANHNHLRGIHACALATLSEYSTGITLLAALDAGKYRIILKNIHMTYHYQAKKAVRAKFSLTDEILNTKIIAPLKEQEAVFIELPVEVFDADGNHISTGLINWQVKDWGRVRTK